jgi:superfamily II DNA or RNA helicase
MTLYKQNVKIRKFDELHIQVITDDRDVILGLKDYFTDYVEGYKFQPKFRNGGWDGKICLVRSGNVLPYGLLLNTLRFLKTHYKEKQLSIDDDVKDLFKGVDVEPEYELNIFPRPYQAEAVELGLKYRSGIIVAATSAGKSLSITYLIKNLMDYGFVKKTLIIVPTVSLICQFKKDMIDYGIDETLIGQAYAKVKEFDKKIVISTWQTLIKDTKNVLESFDCIICDETHQSKALSIKTILSKCVNAKFRYGFTGTMPVSKLDILNVMSYIGPVLKRFGASELAEQGYISKCKINLININYTNTDIFPNDYNLTKDMVFVNKFRLNYIKNIVSKIDGNILLLVGKVEKEGYVLKDYLEKENITDKEIIFLHGETKVEDREKWRGECENRKNLIIIATYGIMSVGVNIPSLKYILFASPFKSKIRVLQSIGRALRKHDTKENAVIFDLADNVKFLDDHSNKRLKYYQSEAFDVTEYTIHENIF